MLIIAVTMFIIFYKYKDERLDPLEYWLLGIFLILPALFTAAAGYVVNDIYDVETDAVNKPSKMIVGVSISKKSAWMLYAILCMISIGLSALFDLLRAPVDNSIFFGESEFGFIYLAINVCLNLLLFIYAVKLKGTPLIGNLLIAICSASVIGICSLLIAIETQAGLLVFFGYLIFSFFISIIRELVKDIQDLPGDKAAGMKTYPIVLGVNGAKILIYVFCFIEILSCGLYSFLTWGLLNVSSIIMGIITLSLFYFINMISRAKQPEEFGNASKFLKFVMFAGVLNLPFS